MNLWLKYNINSIEERYEPGLGIKCSVFDGVLVPFQFNTIDLTQENGKINIFLHAAKQYTAKYIY